MVGPISETERAAGNRALKLGFVLLVGLSTGMMALFGGATVVESLVLLAIGSLIGGGLLLFLLR
ncbi:MAG: hypothetical protein SVG88_12925 [Halobacteriales archaeon]|nr:hypothetical protein [Halobacteriales archaeon]